MRPLGDSYPILLPSVSIQAKDFKGSGYSFVPDNCSVPHSLSLVLYPLGELALKARVLLLH